MGFKLGNTSIGSLYVGSTKIVEAYIGNVKVMSSSPIVYNVTCSGSHGTVTASPSSGIPGTVVTLSNSPDTGYAFNSYTVNGATLTGNTFVIGNSDVNVTGNFTGIVRNVTCTATNGTVTASPNSGIIGTTVTLSNTPNSGYSFDSYTLSGATLKNANQFDIGTSNVSVVGNFIQQSSEELWVDLGSTAYTVGGGSSSNNQYITLTGMPTTSNKNYYTVKFDISGNILIRSTTLCTEICELCYSGMSLQRIAGCLQGRFYQNGAAVGKTLFGFGTKSTKATACTVYSSNFNIGQYSSSSTDTIAFTRNSISGSHAIKFVIDRNNKNVYYYLDNNLICRITTNNSNDLLYGANLYIYGTSSCNVSVKNIKVAGFSTLAEAQAWS